jgi:hypothetical protein
VSSASRKCLSRPPVSTPRANRRGLARADRAPSALDRASKSHGHRLVDLRSNTSLHFSPVRPRIDPRIEHGWNRPTVSCPRTAAK